MELDSYIVCGLYDELFRTFYKNNNISESLNSLREKIELSWDVRDMQIDMQSDHKFLDPDMLTEKYGFISYTYLIKSVKFEKLIQYICNFAIFKIKDLNQFSDVTQWEIVEHITLLKHFIKLYGVDEAVRHNGKIIKYLPYYTYDQSILAIRNEAFIVLELKNVTYEMYLEAIENKPSIISYIKNPTIEMYVKAVKLQNSLINILPIDKLLFEMILIEVPGIKQCLYSYVGYTLGMKNYERFLNYCDRELVYSDDEYMEFIKYNPTNLKYITNPSKELCMRAVRHNYLCMEFIPDQTDELCWEALNINTAAINYIKQPTVKMMRLAIDNGHCSFLCNFFELPEEIQNYVLSLDSNNIQYFYTVSIPILINLFMEENSVLRNRTGIRSLIPNYLIKEYPNKTIHWKLVTDKENELRLSVDGMLLRYVEYFDEHLCQIAVNQNPLAMQYVPTHIQCKITM